MCSATLHLNKRHTRRVVHLRLCSSNCSRHACPLPSVCSNGLEDERELLVEEGVIIAGRYRVVASIGKGSFSRVFQCVDLRYNRLVALKVIRNNKDCFDAALGEIKILAMIMKHDPEGAAPIARFLDYFYYKEHLILVTELLRDSLFHFYKYADQQVTGGSYFKPSILSRVAHQLLKALEFLHSHGVAHCDVKPENVCLVSASRCEVKMIDFGSCVCKQDTRNSYVQSRWYRAPEVMLGLPWDSKIDIWSLGCLLAELLLGYPIFHGSTVPMVLASQRAVLGSLPSSMMSKCREDTLHTYFTPDDEFYLVDPPAKAYGVYILEAVPHPLRQLLPTEDEPTISFIESLLRYDPVERLSAKQALEHPFITAYMERQVSPAPPLIHSPAVSRDGFTLGIQAWGAQSRNTGPGIPADFRRTTPSSEGPDWKARLSRMVGGTSSAHGKQGGGGSDGDKVQGEPSALAVFPWDISQRPAGKKPSVAAVQNLGQPSEDAPSEPPRPASLSR